MSFLKWLRDGDEDEKGLQVSSSSSALAPRTLLGRVWTSGYSSLTLVCCFWFFYLVQVEVSRMVGASSSVPFSPHFQE